MTKVPTLKALSEYQYCQYTSFCAVLFMKAKRNKKQNVKMWIKTKAFDPHFVLFIFYFVVNFISFIPLFFGVPKFTY